MPLVDEVDDSDAALAGVLPVQAAGVLRERAFPGDGYRQYQGVEGRMVEALADQLAGRQQHPRSIGRQPFQFLKQRGPLLRRHPAVQHEQR